MIIGMGYAQAKPGEIDRMTEGLLKMVVASNAEDGCLHYGYSRDLADPDRMIICERWRDQAALDAHFASPHMAEYQALLATTTLLKVHIMAYQVSDERVLVSR